MRALHDTVPMVIYRAMQAANKNNNPLAINIEQRAYSLGRYTATSVRKPILSQICSRYASDRDHVVCHT